MVIFGCYFLVCDNCIHYINSVTRLLGFIDYVISTNLGYKICAIGDLNFKCRPMAVIIIRLLSIE